MHGMIHMKYIDPSDPLSFPTFVQNIIILICIEQSQNHNMSRQNIFFLM